MLTARPAGPIDIYLALGQQLAIAHYQPTARRRVARRNIVITASCTHLCLSLHIAYLRHRYYNNLQTMCIEPAPSADILTRKEPYYLVPFDKIMAPLVASWVADHHQLFWLAPQTYPPLTAEKVLAWHKPEANPLLFYRDGLDQPLGYGELNTMPGQKEHYWMGHCIIRPQSRGLGLGRQFVNLLLEYGFNKQNVKQISLIAFPENSAAIRCYLSCGFVNAGEQLKYFPTTGHQHRMVLMTVDSELYEHRHSQT